MARDFRSGRVSGCIALLVLAVGVVPGCSTLRMDPQQVMHSVWPVEGGNALRSNAVSQHVAPPLQLRWRFNAQAGFGRVSPLVLGNAVLVANRKGEVHAVDLESGKRFGRDTFGESIEGTPVYVDGMLVVPIAWGGRAVRALDLLTGARLWRAGDIPVNSGLTVWGDFVLAGDVEGYVRAWRLQDGEEVWSVQPDERSGIHSTPVLIGDVLVVANDRGRVTALNPSDGSFFWSADAGAPVQVSLAATEDMVFAATTRGSIRAFDVHTGILRWAYDLTDGEEGEYTADRGGSSMPGGGFTPPYRYLTAPAVGERDVVFGASDGIVRSLDMENGSLNWEADVFDAVSAPPVITAETVYVGTMGALLIGFDRNDGSRIWDTKLDGRIKSAFALKESRLIVLAEPRHVYVYEPDSGGDETEDE